MSRIIVKNLPSNIKEDRLRSLFSQKGTITDCALKYTKDGVFRKFAFIGYSDPTEASAAVKHFHKSFIDTSRLSVDIAQDITDANKPKAWSKYTKMKRGSKDSEKGVATTAAPMQKGANKAHSNGGTNPVSEILANLRNEPEFQQFLAAHKNKSQKALWVNDDGEINQTAEKVLTAGQETSSDLKSAALAYAFEGESDSDSDSDDDVSRKRGVAPPTPSSPKGVSSLSKQSPDSKSKAKPASDLDYLRSKMKSNTHLDSDDDTDESDGDGSPRGAGDSDTEVSLAAEGRGEADDVEGGADEAARPASNTSHKMLTVKLRGLPHNVREKQIREFLMPLTAAKIGIPRNGNRQTIGIAFASFVIEKDFEQALRKTRTYMGTHKVFVTPVKSKEDMTASDAACGGSADARPRPWESKAVTEEPEAVGESGQLYVRNLAYICKEDDLEKLFGKYGPITEVNVPIDKFTKKIKGFAHITYMMPEHAVRALTDLDGTTFQGRILHILPGRSVHSEEQHGEGALPGGSSYKKKKEAEQKKAAGSSHNWNALFLGSSAVADLMAEKYKVKKSQILDADSAQSLGVRMALGETQLVAETRDFLLSNGIALDSFSQAAGARSKTVILVKNLPASTPVNEIVEAFGKFGSLGRVVLPPHGITAVVEFVEPTEARAAFTSLAYTRFKDLPLYLEWAPTGVFSSSFTSPPDNEDKDESSDEENAAAPAVPGATLFVKNLDVSTTEAVLAEHFSSCGKVRKTEIAKKKDVQNAGKLKSMGYGFVEFADRQAAQKALKQKQHSILDGQPLQLKVSERTSAPLKNAKKKSSVLPQKSQKAPKTTKILVRNVPFEATRKELAELFKVFGELKYVRLPKKVSGTGSHRGFAFVDFLTRADAKKAFNALCHSTHLYGRRLVLEWAEADSSVDEMRLKTAEHFHDGDGPRKRLKKQQLIADLNTVSSDRPGEASE